MIVPLNALSAAQLTDDDLRWQAVEQRRADRTFVCAVVTTGIYCRSNCSARRPLRKNVRFFATGAEAAAAGFRPCKRCKPTATA